MTHASYKKIREVSKTFQQEKMRHMIEQIMAACVEGARLADSSSDVVERIEDILIDAGYLGNLEKYVVEGEEEANTLVEYLDSDLEGNNELERLEELKFVERVVIDVYGSNVPATMQAPVEAMRDAGMSQIDLALIRTTTENYYIMTVADVGPSGYELYFAENGKQIAWNEC